MVICFKCDSRTKQMLDGLLQSGSFRDESEVIASAIASFATLHSELQEKSVVVFGAPEQATGGGAVAEGAQKSAAPHDTPLRPKLVPNIPEIFRRETHVFGVREDRFAPLPADVFAKDQIVPLDRWIFGQYSKLLPVKASIRAIATLEFRRKTDALDKLAGKVAREAAALGEYFRIFDERLNLQRDDALAVGFPSNEENAEKSRLRYANQYVGALKQQGTLSGALIDLKFINSITARPGRVALTRAGWEFALLENPALDLGDPTGQKFSDDEKASLIEHILRCLPAEAFAFRTLLRAIIDGATTPEAADQVAWTYVPEQKKATITKAFVTTQRSGAISRMADLGLLTRVRDGVRVRYMATDAGDSFIHRPAVA